MRALAATLLLLTLITLNSLPSPHQPKNLESHPLLKPLWEWNLQNPSKRHLPFGLFVGIGLLALLSQPNQTPQKKTLLILSTSFAVLTLLELSHLYIPTRTFDPKDLLWGWAGTITLTPILLLSYHTKEASRNKCRISLRLCLKEMLLKLKHLFLDRA